MFSIVNFPPTVLILPQGQVRLAFGIWESSSIVWFLLPCLSYTFLGRVEVWLHFLLKFLFGIYTELLLKQYIH